MELVRMVELIIVLIHGIAECIQSQALLAVIRLILP